MDINVLMRRSGLKASAEEIAVLEKDLENILETIAQLPEPDQALLAKAAHHLHAMELAKDVAFNDASKEEILKNAKAVEDDMFKVGLDKFSL